MLGTKARLFQPISAISLDELVPADHFYRRLDRVLDLSHLEHPGPGQLCCDRAAIH